MTEIEQIRAHNLRMRRLNEELRERGDELSLLAAGLIEGLRARTAAHLGYTDEPTGARVALYAPSTQHFILAGERPLALQMLARMNSGSESFEDTAEPKDITEILKGLP